MRLLPPNAFAEVFEPLRGKRIGFFRPIGNVGDRLIEMATFQRFDAFEIDWTIQDPAGPIGSDVDELFSWRRWQHGNTLAARLSIYESSLCSQQLDTLS